MRIAIVTGASSGLGVVFTQTIANKYKDLDEIWIIARRKGRLDDFSKTCSNINIRVLALDLGNNSSFIALDEILQKENPEIQVLVNNAGYEKTGDFDKMNTDDIMAMINLNVKGMTAMNRLCFPYMKSGSFAILTCSVSSFVSIPFQAVYSATKAYVRFLGAALREEMKSKKINILSLCPGNMDTEMNPKSEMTQSKKVNRLPFLNLKMVAKKSLDKAQKGKAVYTPGEFYKFYRFTSEILPSEFMIKFIRNFFTDGQR